LLVRIDTTLGRRAAFDQAWENLGHEVQMRRELTEAVGQLLTAVNTEPILHFTDQDKTDLFDLSNFLTWARSSVRRDYRDDVISPHSPEQPPRVGKQLLQLLRGACALGMSLDLAMALAARCAHDSINPTRLAMLLDLEQHPKSSIAQVAKRVSLPYMTVKRTLEGLWTLELVSRDEVPGATTPYGEYEYALTSRVKPSILHKFHITQNREPCDDSGEDPTITKNTKPLRHSDVPF